MADADDILKRIEALERRRLLLDDLPVEQLRNEILRGKPTDPVELLLPKSIKADLLPADVITSAEIAPDAVGQSELAANSVGPTEMAVPTGTYYAVPNLGNAANVAATANTFYAAEVIVFDDTNALTGVFFNCSVTAGGNVKAAIYDSAGVRLRDGTNTALTATPFKAPFTSTVTCAPGLYFIGVVFDSGSTITFSSALTLSNTTAVGSYNTPSPLTVPTTAGTFVPSMSTY